MNYESNTHAIRIARWPIYPVLCYVGLLLGLLTLSRLILIGWQYDRVGSLENAVTVLVYGIRFDFIVACFLFLIPALTMLLMPRSQLINRIFSLVGQYWLMLVTLLVIFVEISTPAFIDQYDTRPNRIYFEYLDTPVEVFNSAVYEYPWHFVVAFILMTLLVRFLLGFNRRIFSSIEPWPVITRLIMVPVVLLVCVLGIRSSIDHRAANPSTVAFTNDQLVNKLGMSSMYNVMYAYYSLRHEESSSGLYGDMPAEDMVAIVREQMMLDSVLFSRGPDSTWHQQSTNRQPNQANLVIILQESLGAGFSGKLGGIGVTPEIDKLADQGLWLTRLYSTGTRSARGLEAVITGFPPSPSRSVLKLGLAQQNFSTIASILKQHNYQTEFIYGGESHFDNMAGFFLANGFDRVTDENDYPDASFRGVWGVSDEDLFERVDQTLNTESDKPKFILAFSSSNHVPFEFPDNKITLHDSEKQTVNNAVKYADFAVGQFFAQAKKRAYWNNTYFLIASDHDTRVYGNWLVPVNKFHIPGLILGPDIEPAQYTRPASQIDLAPTLLDYLGISNEHPMIGHSLLNMPDDFPGRAIMQFGNNHAYMRGDQVVVHQPQKPGKQFVYNEQGFNEVEADPELVKIARAHALWPSFAYREKKY